MDNAERMRDAASRLAKMLDRLNASPSMEAKDAEQYHQVISALVMAEAYTDDGGNAYRGRRAAYAGNAYNSANAAMYYDPAVHDSWERAYRGSAYHGPAEIAEELSRRMQTAPPYARDAYREVIRNLRGE